MAIVSRVRLQVLTVTGASLYSIDQWAEQLKAKAERLNQNRKDKIQNSNMFSALLAGPSAVGYSGVINPDFVSRSGLDAIQITAKQASNIAKAFEKYEGQLDFIFEEVDGVPAKRFKELVDRAKNDWSRGMADKSLRFSGERKFFFGLSGLAGMWLTDDPTTEVNLRGGDQILVGGPKRICTEDNKSTLKTMLNQKLIQSGSSLIDLNWDSAAITAENDKLNATVNGMRDPALNIATFATTVEESHINWIMDNGTPYLEVQVGLTP